MQGVRRMLSISTQHITEGDSRELSAWCSSAGLRPALVAEYEYGWMLYVWDEAPKEAESLSSSFHKALVFARQKDCSYIQFDSDGNVWDELDGNDW